MSWLIGLVAAALALWIVTRRMNPTSRQAAFRTLGERHAWKVAGWPFLRIVLALAVLGGGYLLARGGESGGPAAAPAAPATGHAAAGGGGISPWAFIAAALLVLGLGLALAFRRRTRSNWQLDQLLLEDDEEIPVHRGPHPYRAWDESPGRDQTTEQIDTEGQDDDEHGGAGFAGDVDEGDAADEGGPLAPVRHLPRRRGGADRPL